MATTTSVHSDRTISERFRFDFPNFRLTKVMGVSPILQPIR
jgi:hypothetical protein